MGVASWWAQRRFGIHWHASLASVPAWAPIGAYPSWYRPHLEPGLPDLLHHVSPLVEAIEHHQRHWPEIERFDQFLAHLDYAEFDPDELVDLATRAGADYTLVTAKHHDGLCWWKAPGSDRTVLHDGPARDVLRGWFDAARRRDLPIGATYSLLDWADARYPGPGYVLDVVHPHVTDLVQRYEPDLLWADGHWGYGESAWRTDELFASLLRSRPDLVVNDRWWSSRPAVRTLEYRMPDTARDEPWELRRGLGLGMGLNSAEGDRHLLGPCDVVATLTECVAKGGALTLVLGLDRHGRLPDDHRRRIEIAGAWIDRHAEVLRRSVPWTEWGDDDVRYLADPADERELTVVDVGGRGRCRALRGLVDRIESVTGVDDRVPVGFEVRDDALRIDTRPRRSARATALPTVFRVSFRPVSATPIRLFADTTPEPRELAAAVEGAAAGDVIGLGDGTYVGPARIPDGVTVRGLGADRTRIDGWESCAVVLGAGSRLEHCAVSTRNERIVWVPKVVVSVTGAAASVIGCSIDGHVDVDADDVRIVSSALTGVTCVGHDRLTIARSTLTGMNWDDGIEIEGGHGHVIDSNELDSFLAAVRLRSTVDVEVRGNQMSTRWWGCHLLDTQQTSVVANRCRGITRAVHVAGGADATVTGNAVHDGDSGCLVDAGAVGVVVEGNHWARCRVGLMAWDAGPVGHHGNRFEPGEVADARELVIGPD